MKQALNWLLRITGVVAITLAGQLSLYGFLASVLAVLCVLLGLLLIEIAVLRDHHRRAYPKRWVCDRCPAEHKFMVESNSPDTITVMTAQHLRWHNEEGA